MNGSEAIKILGRKMLDGFDIDSEPRLSVYKKVFDNFSIGLEEGINNKGILLIGNIGVGKTILMKIMQKLFIDSRRAFRWITCSDLVDMMEYYSTPQIKTFYGRDLKMDLYIDDVGIGSSVQNRYGNTINLISEIIHERYDLFISEGHKTHISSNRPTSLDINVFPDVITLEKLYGDRVVDRLREMCEVVIFKGESLRKKENEFSQSK